MNKKIGYIKQKTRKTEWLAQKTKLKNSIKNCEIFSNQYWRRMFMKKKSCFWCCKTTFLHAVKHIHIIAGTIAAEDCQTNKDCIVNRKYSVYYWAKYKSSAKAHSNSYLHIIFALDTIHGCLKSENKWAHQNGC